ncbi:hypothetical protein GWI33_011720 [Rhynchophorus ferrugineus]|uniref:PX domain-containing protein n=1 Tax=Rhynchophorus ferrugineus TaxID=354439 RepID=A0A834IQ62_RHYFE|nr:hypothetical protein GWI33_011720 [Rhynchophorus ferrugineus]
MNAKEQRSMKNNGNIMKKIDTLLNHIEITVSESEKRNNGALNLRDYYTVYLIDTKVTDPNFQHKLAKIATVWRRYTEFEQLRDYLEVTYPYIVFPPLPEKRVMFGWQKISNDTFDPNFIDRRRAGLENFLLRVASHPILNWDTHFIEFLQEEDGWKESVKSNGYLQLMENKWKNLSVSIRLKRPDPQFEAFKEYSHNLYTNLNNLLKTRCKVAERQYAVHKLHGNYASCIDAALEDEELLADQLKEYLFFANSLLSVCKNREVLQLQLEDSEENIANKNIERTKVQQGKSGLMSRLFGAVDTDEVRELKVNMLDQQIHDGAVAVNNNKETLGNFSTKALEDIERFQIQKNMDLRETLTSYAFLQLKTAKKGLQTWVQIRDCLLNIP